MAGAPSPDFAANSDVSPTDILVRRAALSQLLFSAGNAVTVGAFFSYFFEEFSPGALLVAVSLILPETAQAISVVTSRTLLPRVGRKQLYFAGLLGGRLFAMLIPVALCFPTEWGTVGVWWILACTALWYLLQGTAYVSLISWLSDLVPEVRWGRLNSRREIAALAFGVGLPLFIAWLRRQWLSTLTPDAKAISYALIFVGGGLVVLTSLLPLLSLPEVDLPLVSARKPTAATSITKFSAPFWQLTLSRWWGAIFQGLTQATFFLFAVRVLKLELMTYIALGSLGRLLQVPVTWLAGRLSDTSRDKLGLVVGLLLASAAMPFWLFATPERWWLLCLAYACWSGFGLVNVCGNNLCLKLAPRSGNATHFALYEQGAGLLAGLAGLLGGLWLQQLSQHASVASPEVSTGVFSLLKTLLHPAGADDAATLPYRVLFLVSWLGRMMTPLWLVGLRQPHTRE